MPKERPNLELTDKQQALFLKIVLHYVSIVSFDRSFVFYAVPKILKKPDLLGFTIEDCDIDGIEKEYFKEDRGHVTIISYLYELGDDLFLLVEGEY